MLKAFYVHCELPSDVAVAEAAILFQDEGAKIFHVFGDALAIQTEMSRSEIIHVLNHAPLSGRHAVFVGKTKPDTSVLEISSSRT